MPGTAAPPQVRLSEILSALSLALDLTEGEDFGHAMRTCVIGMRLAEAIALPGPLRPPLYYALLLKDAGCSSNAQRMAALFSADDRHVKPATKLTDWSRYRALALHAVRQAAPGQSLGKRAAQWVVLARAGPEAARQLVETRCERGASIARRLGLPAETAEAIAALDEHWDGGGHPRGLRGHAIPLLAQIAGISQTVDVFLTRFGLDRAMDVVRARRGRWFSPDLAGVLLRLGGERDWWAAVASPEVARLVREAEPPDRILHAGEGEVDEIAAAFADIVDAKSSFTYRHSRGVARVATAMGEVMGLDAARLRDLQRAALLHDIGKLGVGNHILDKPGPLTPEEFAAVKLHPRHTFEILRRVPAFGSWAALAAAHHERLDGSGYHLGVRSADLPPEARMLMVADVFDALAAERPYRPALPRDRVLEIMGAEAGRSLCPACFQALQAACPRL